MVNNKKAYTYFNNEFGLKRSTNGWYSSHCPICDKSNKRYTHFHYGVTKCYTCDPDEGKAQGVIYFLMYYLSVSYLKAKEILEEYEESDLEFTVLVDYTGNAPIATVNLPENYKPILSGENMLATRARNYLVSRKLDLEYADSIGIGYVDKRDSDFKKDFFGYLVIPFKRGGVLYYYQTRAFLGQELRYKNPNVDNLGIGKSEIIFNQDALNLHKKVFLFEGVFDALTLKDNATAILGKSLSSFQKELIIKSHCKEVIIGMDEGCIDEAKQIGIDLIDYKKVKILDFVGGDPNELGMEHVLELAEKTPYSDLADLLL